MAGTDSMKCQVGRAVDQDIEAVRPARMLLGE